MEDGVITISSEHVKEKWPEIFVILIFFISLAAQGHFIFKSGYNSRAVCTAILLQTDAATIADECFIWLTLIKGIGP